MAEPHVIGALRNKRAELSGTLRQLEQQLAGHRANLAHLDATMRLFDPNIRPKDIRPRQQRKHNAWFRQGECLRLIYDELRKTAQPVTTRELAERIMRVKAIPAADGHQRELVQKRDCRKVGGRAATAIGGYGSLAGQNFCPKPEPRVPL